MAAAPDTVPNLERLSRLETITLKQQYSSYKGNNYAIVSEEELLFNLIEEQNDSIFSGGNRRGFHMDGLDSDGRQVFRLRRPVMCFSDKLQLFMNDALVSVVRMAPTSCAPRFNINDAQDCPTLRLKGNICDHAMKFQLHTNTKTNIGSVEKIFRGWRNEMLNRKDDYIIIFPADLAVHFKLAVVAATILIDFRFHEYRRRRH